MDPTRKQITGLDGVTYTFRYPSSMDYVQIDVEARNLRQGVTEGLTFGFGYSQNIALLNHLCAGPEDTDFGKLPAYVMDQVSEEVTKWIDSFRKPVAAKQGTVDPQQG